MRLRVLLLLWLSLCGLYGCTSVFLYPDRVQHLAERDPGTPAEDVWITAADGSDLHALYLPSRDPPRATVLFLHGNAENLSSHVHAVAWLPARGYAVLAVDYRGYGRSQGSASVDGVHEDAAAALDWLLRARQGARADDTAPVVIYGQSLGASVAIALAAATPSRERIAAVIADSAFSSYRRIAREKLAQAWLTWPLQWPLSWLISDHHAAIDVVGRLSPVPLLLIHGEGDLIVDARHSQRLYDAAGEPRELWLIPEGRHIDAPRRESVRERMVGYLDSVTAIKVDAR